MAWDAGAIEARLTISTAEASADLDKIEARVRALEGSPHVVRINAVFDSADIGRARHAFAMLDNAISYDAMQRLRSSPQGSVLGALNALFSPHPVIGGPSPQQAAAKGLLGQMFSSQGGGTTVVPGAQGQGGSTTILRDVVTGQQPQKVTVSETGEGASAADQAAAAAQLRAAAGDLQNAVIGLAGIQSVFAALRNMFAGGAGSAAAAAAGGGAGGGAGAGTAAAAGAAAGGGGGGGGAGAAAAGAAAAGGLAGAAAQTASAMQNAGKSTGFFNDAISKGLPLWTAGAGRAGFLQGKIQLFGGALTNIGVPAILAAQSGLELIVHSALDLSATLIPATVAFTAFGVAAVPTVKDLYSILKSTYTVSQAFGTSIYPLTGGFQKMADAVKPEVYTLFGEGLVLANKQSGTFATLAQEGGKALDDLGARFVYATTQGSGFSKFVAGAGQDLAGWGNLIGNIGGIISGVLKAMPGYASAVLNVLNGVTHAIEGLVNSRFGQWFLSIGLAAHGALVYVGLLGTGFALLATRGLPLLASVLASTAGFLGNFGKVGKAAGLQLAGLSVAADRAATLPWGWISIAAAGFGFLIYQLVTAKNATQQFFAQLQQTAQNAPLLQLQGTLAAQAAAAQKDLAAATAQTNFEQKRFNDVLANQPGLVRPASIALGIAQSNQADYAAGLAQIQGEQATVNQHIADAAKIFHTTSAAWAALNAAGVTSAQLLDTNKQHWAEALIEAQAYDNTLRAVTQTSGRYGAAQNALNFTAGDSANALGQVVSAMSKVTAAEDQLLNTILGGEQAFIGFQQGIVTMGKDAGAAGASLGGLNSQSLTLGNDYYSTVVPGLQKMIDALQNQNASTSDLTKVVATGAQEALAYAGNNDAARAVMVALINNALGPGTVSLKNLNTWVNNNSTSIQGMNTIVANATIQAGDFAGVLQAQVIPMMTQASVAALGGKTSMVKFATGVLNGNSAATLWTQDGAAKIVRMFEVMTGGSIPRAKAAFESWATNTLGIGTTAAKNLADQLFASTNPAVAAAGEAARAAAQKIKDAAQTIDSSFIKSLQQIGFDSPGINTDISNLSSAILSTGDSSRRTRNDRAKLIQDLIAAGVQADTARQMVNNLQTQIDNLHGKKLAVDVTAQANGKIAAVAGNARQVLNFVSYAGGGLVPGNGAPKADDQLILASSGEFMMSADAVKQYGVPVMEALNARKFANGGVIGALANAANWTGTQDWNFVDNAEVSFMQNVISAFKKSVSAGGTPVGGPGGATGASGGGSPAANAALARAIYPQYTADPTIWNAWNYVAMRESGWNNIATNPTSGAFGIAQALPYTKMPKAAWPTWAGGSADPRTQIIWMWDYMASSYGGPVGAAAHEAQYNWYDNGGWLRPGWTMAYNGTGRLEQVIPPGKGASGTSQLADTIIIQQPEGTTLAAAFTELTWQLQAARMRQGMPGG